MTLQGFLDLPESRSFRMSGSGVVGFFYLRPQDLGIPSPRVHGVSDLSLEGYQGEGG